jgi:DNA-directed RNA polymerase specialized sigma24 family protein
VDEDREVLRLAAWEDLTPTEIAVVLGVPAGTNRWRLHRARTSLRARAVDVDVDVLRRIAVNEEA